MFFTLIITTDATFGSLVAQASITLVNNQGNIGKTLKELGHSNTVRATITAMLTAGSDGMIHFKKEKIWKPSYLFNIFLG